MDSEQAPEGSGLGPGEDDPLAAPHVECAAEVMGLVAGGEPSNHDDVVVIDELAGATIDRC